MGVLQAIAMLDPVDFSPAMACDIGAGSGILSLAIANKFDCPVMAGDILAEAVEVIHANARAQGREEWVRAVQADGFDHPMLRAQAPYDLIVMNILAGPILALAVEAVYHLAPEGVLVLSGLLVWQEENIVKAYQELGLELSARIVLADWVTLVWQKPSMAVVRVPR
jgi:ribosomal protein L11 methyltransferase